MAKYSETARERELCRYYRPVEPSTRPEGSTPPLKSSTDTAVTAFAQLSVLRLNAARCIISLVGSKREYVLAEASQTLSLQDETRHDVGDHLWFGEGALAARSEIGAILIKLFSEDSHNSEGPPPYIEINDLRKEELFKDLPIVTGMPFARSLICLPLRSARGYVIGLYCVVDDKVRNNVKSSELRFLEDMATTVMNHIESNRVRQRHDRAEKMVKALAIFLEGGGSLREWWLNQAKGGRSIQQSQIDERSRRGFTLQQQADIALGIQDGPDRFLPASIAALRNSERIITNSDEKSVASSPSSIRIGHTIGTSASSTTIKPNTTVSGISSVPTHATTVKPKLSRQMSPADPVSYEPEQSNLPGKELQEALLSADVKKSLGRASNLVREATDLDGVAFYDASLGSLGGGMIREGMKPRPPGARTFDSSAPDTSSSGSDATHSSREKSDQESSSISSISASVLGFSTRSRSSLKEHTNSEQLGPFPERLLRLLAKRYPHGTIYNFEDDGSISSSDAESQSGGILSSSSLKDETITENVPIGVHQRKEKKRLSREAEAAAIYAVIPGARSVAWFPLWDSGSERWYAGSLIWSLDPTRILVPEDELIYLAAWGNSIMAEVSRLSAVVASQMKVDFVSSISHELRSPLHGILASVEFLQEEENLSPTQADMINTINSCGKTLLDTIDHVLDFAKISKKKTPRHKRYKHDRKDSPHALQQAETTPADDISDISILSEEVLDSVYAGRSHKAITQHSILQAPVVVVVDIAWHSDWNFRINVGAFRRIIMNLFSNALKYTENGFVKAEVTLVQEQPTRNGNSQTNLHLTVSDSGKGISREFLREHLYTAFKQEDALSAGTGLGLSIVQRIVHDINGTIGIESELGSGTKAHVIIPVRLAHHRPPVDHMDVISQVKSKTKGKRMCIVNQGFDIYPNMSDEPTGILSPESQAMIFLKSSLESMASTWFDMEVVSSPHLDLDTAEIHMILASDESEEQLRVENEDISRPKGDSVVIVICAASYRGVDFTTFHGTRVFYLRAPVFPHKLAKLLHGAFFTEVKWGPGIAKSPLTSPDISEGHHFLGEAEGILSAATNIPQRPALGRRESSKIKRSFHAAEANIDSSPSPSLTPPSATLSPHTHKVLLVEDNEINLRLLEIHMSKLKQDHATATNGLEAFNAYKVANGHFDIILMDLQMPIMNGLESTREIRRFEHENGFGPTAIVALTGAASLSARQEAFSSGMDLFLTKPVAMKVLKELLIELRDRGRAALRDFG